MLVDMITAEQARTKVYIEIMNKDLRTAKMHIMEGIAHNKAGVIAIRGRFINSVSTMTSLKELGYRIRQCPVDDSVVFIQWEEPAADDLQLAFTWSEI